MPKRYLVGIVLLVVLAATGATMASAPPERLCGICGEHLEDELRNERLPGNVSESALTIELRGDGSGVWTEEVVLPRETAATLAEDESLRSTLVHQARERAFVAVDDPQFETNVDNRTLAVRYTVSDMSERSFGVFLVDFFYTEPSRFYDRTADRLVVRGPDETTLVNRPPEATAQNGSAVWSGRAADGFRAEPTQSTFVAFAEDDGVVTQARTILAIGARIAPLYLSDLLIASFLPMVLLGGFATILRAASAGPRGSEESHDRAGLLKQVLGAGGALFVCLLGLYTLGMLPFVVVIAAAGIVGVFVAALALSLFLDSGAVDSLGRYFARESSDDRSVSVWKTGRRVGRLALPTIAIFSFFLAVLSIVLDVRPGELLWFGPTVYAGIAAYATAILACRQPEWVARTNPSRVAVAGIVAVILAYSLTATVFPTRLVGGEWFAGSLFVAGILFVPFGRAVAKQRLAAVVTLPIAATPMLAALPFVPVGGFGPVVLTFLLLPWVGLAGLIGLPLFILARRSAASTDGTVAGS